MRKKRGVVLEKKMLLQKDQLSVFQLKNFHNSTYN